MKFNRNFAKLKSDGTLEFAPIPLTVVTHHHEEWDESVIDPETGEPTGETEHMSRDWDTSRREVFPTAADFRQMGYLPVDYAWRPAEPAPEGKQWSKTGKYVEADGTVRPEYAAVDIPPAHPRTFSKLKLYAALAHAGLWDVLRSWLESQTFEGINAYTAFSLAQKLTDAHPMFQQWFAAAKTALGVSDETAEAILAASVAKGV